MPPSDRQRLQDDIRTVCEMMIKVHYYEESNWLWLAVTSPASCASARAREVLRAARVVALQFGYPHVADWLDEEILGQEPSR